MPSQGLLRLRGGVGGVVLPHSSGDGLFWELVCNGMPVWLIQRPNLYVVPQAREKDERIWLLVREKLLDVI